jgi:glycosyl transferase family 25
VARINAYGESPVYSGATRVRVISLDSAKSRRTRFAAHASEARLPWEFFDAQRTCGEELVYDEEGCIARKGRSLSSAELGCYTSHYRVWADFIKSGDSQLVVLEDDVTVDWEYLEKLSKVDLHADGIDYLRMYSLAMPPSRKLGEYQGRYLYELLGMSLGAQAYVLTRDGARRLLEHCRLIRSPIDDMMDRSWWGAPPSLALFPYPVMDVHSDSSIGTARDTGPKWTMARRLRRYAFRVVNAVRLRLYRLKASTGRTNHAKADRRWL